MKRHFLYSFSLFFSWKSQFIVKISLYKSVIYYPKFVFWSWRKLLKYVLSITNVSKCRIKILKGKKVRIYSLFSNTFWLIAVSFLVFFSEICCCLTLKWDQIVGNDVSSFLNFHGWHEMMCHTRKNLASKSGHKNKLGKFNIP